ncbi:MAG TPA: Ig-like domain-containing protein, partial [bacterium]|nr:Ig-like domain-containing protein [bacterium]
MKTKLFKIVFFLIIINTLFVSSAFALWVEPSSLNFGTYETSLTVTLTSTFGIGYQIPYGVESKPGWVICGGGTFPDPGNVGAPQPAQVQVSVNRTGLTPGQTYSGTVKFYDRLFSTSYAYLSVSMRVPLPAQLSVSPGSYNFGEGGTTCQFAVQNTGESTLNWSVSEGLSWLSLSSSGGSVAPGGLQYVSAMVNRGTLTPETYTGTISFTSSKGGSQSVSVSMTVPDTIPPTGTISINSGDIYANSTSVTLTLSASDSGGVNKMQFSNDGVSFSSEEDYATSKSWTLTAGDGLKTVYVQYKDNAGNWGGLISDTIILDNTLPSGTILIDDGAESTDSTSVTLTLWASDSGSGVSKMQFSNDGVVFSSEEDYATSKSWTLTTGDGTKTVYVRHKDNAGNWS